MINGLRGQKCQPQLPKPGQNNYCSFLVTHVMSIFGSRRVFQQSQGPCRSRWHADQVAAVACMQGSAHGALDHLLSGWGGHIGRPGQMHSGNFVDQLTS